VLAQQLDDPITVGLGQFPTGIRRAQPTAEGADCDRAGAGSTTTAVP
jgi:hypothetical protein